MDMKWVNEKTIEIWNSAKENYNLSDKVECLICIEHLISLIDAQETSMQIMENQIESTSIKTKELEKQLQKEAMKHLSLLDQIKELEEENKRLKDAIKNAFEDAREGYYTEAGPLYRDFLDWEEEFNQH